MSSSQVYAKFAEWIFQQDRDGAALYPATMSFEDLPAMERFGYLLEAEHYLTSPPHWSWSQAIGKEAKKYAELLGESHPVDPLAHTPRTISAPGQDGGAE